MQSRKKSGMPLMETFENPLFLHALSPICERLNHSIVNIHAHVTEHQLGKALFLFTACMERYLGKDGRYKHVMTKLPEALLKDLKLEGSVHSILNNITKKPAKFLQSFLGVWDSADTSLSKGSKNQLLINEGLQLFQDIEDELWDKGVLKNKKIFFGHSIPPNVVSELRSVVSKHKGEIVKNETLATHIIEWYITLL